MTATPPHDPRSPAAVAAAEEAALWPTWFAAVRQPEVDHAVRDLYHRLDAQVTARGPTCWTSGKCCNFDAYGHRLYVTGLEIAWVVTAVQGSEFGVQSSGEKSGGTAKRGAALPLFNSEPRTPNPEQPSCPYQVDRLCSIHAVRPMGCRVFFCQQGTQEWQHELYERFLAELRQLHDARSLPYRYMEWRYGLAQAVVGQGSTLPSGAPGSAQPARSPRLR